MKRNRIVQLLFSSLATPSSGKTINNIGFFLCLFKSAGSETVLSKVKEK